MKSPPSRRSILQDTALQIASYAIGLPVVILLAGVSSDTVVLVGGVVAFLLGYLTLHYALFRRLPTLGMGPPGRYSLPNGIGLLAALVLVGRQNATTTFALAMPLIILGQLLSQLWWSSASPSGASRGAS